MQDKKNIYFILTSFLFEIGGKSKESILALIFGQKLKKDGILFSIFSHVVSRGPEKFRRHPTGIALGRGIFAPLALLLSHRNLHESDDKK